jgi:hypothetical protein
MKTRRARKTRSKTKHLKKRGGVYTEMGVMVTLLGIVMPFISGILPNLNTEEYIDETPYIYTPHEAL